FALWGFPCALVVAGATLYRFSLSGGLWRPWIVLGNASYALYLVHPFMSMPRLVTQRIFGVSEGLWLDHPIAYGIAVLALMIGVSLAVHLLIERPVTRALRRWSGSGRTASLHSHSASARESSSSPAPVPVSYGATDRG